MAAVIFAAYLLISQLADIGFGTIADELRNAELAWVLVALVLAQTTFIPSGISVRGGVATPLPLLPCIVLQSALKFINLTVPSSAGRDRRPICAASRDGGSPRRGDSRWSDRRRSRTRSSNRRSSYWSLPFVGVDLDTSQFQTPDPTVAF